MIDTVRDAASAFEEAVDALSTDELAASSRLPGWSRRHVIAHVALNAEAFVHVAAALHRTVGVALMYPGGSDRRDLDIERLAAAPAPDLIARLRTANAGFASAWSSDAPTGHCATARGHAEFSTTTIPLRRLRELQVHLIDLHLESITHDDWLEVFVDADLAEQWPTVAHRTIHPVAAIDEHGRSWTSNCGTEEGSEQFRIRRSLLLAWVLDRADPAGFPSLAPWGNRSRWEHVDPWQTTRA